MTRLRSGVTRMPSAWTLRKLQGRVTTCPLPVLHVLRASLAVQRHSVLSTHITASTILEPQHVPSTLPRIDCRQQACQCKCVTCEVNWLRRYGLSEGELVLVSSLGAPAEPESVLERESTSVDADVAGDTVPDAGEPADAKPTTSDTADEVAAKPQLPTDAASQPTPAAAGSVDQPSTGAQPIAGVAAEPSAEPQGGTTTCRRRSRWWCPAPRRRSGGGSSRRCPGCRHGR